MLLDHAIYAKLNDELRINYASLWSGMLTQNEKLIENSSKAMGIEKYKLFATILTDKKYDDIMDKEKKYWLKERMAAEANEKKVTEMGT